MMHEGGNTPCDPESFSKMRRLLRPCPAVIDGRGHSRAVPAAPGPASGGVTSERSLAQLDLPDLSLADCAGPAPHQVLVPVLGLQHVRQLAQVAPVSLLVWPRGEGGGQDALRHVREVQVPAALHERVQAEAPGRCEACVRGRGAGSPRALV